MIQVLETMKELISRFPNKKDENVKNLEKAKDWISFNSPVLSVFFCGEIFFEIFCLTPMSIDKKYILMKEECDSWGKLDQPIRLQVCRQQKGDIKCPGLVELIEHACRGKLDPGFGRIRDDQKENSFNRTYRVATIIEIGLTFEDHMIAFPD